MGIKRFPAVTGSLFFFIPISQDMVLAIPKPSIFAAVLIKLSINMDKEYIELFTAVMGLAIVVIDLICKLKKKKE